MVCQGAQIVNRARRAIRVNLIDAAGHYLLRNYMVEGGATDRDVRLTDYYDFIPGPNQMCTLTVQEVGPE